MCGVAGVLTRFDEKHLDVRECESLTDAITHRGPDSRGIWSFNKISLGSVRLAIVDPVVESNQPMKSKDGRFILVFNGEIYNYELIRQELIQSGIVFQTKSDTEVVLESFIKWGVNSFEKFNGMWSIAIWDNFEEYLTCSRDRYGKKPFYWALDSGKFAFSSEIKSFISIGIDLIQDVGYFHTYFHGQGIDAYQTSPFKNIKSLPAGNFLTVNKNLEITSQSWWKGISTSRSGLESKSVFRKTFQNAVEIRLPPNQKFAISLSGGLDSSAVASMTRHLMDSGVTEIQPSSVTCYTVVLDNVQINELQDAQRTAEILGFNHEKVGVDFSNFRELVQEITWHQESLVWTSAAVSFRALYMAISADGNKVALEGHGSDEYLAGYPMYARFAMLDALKRLDMKNAYSYFSLLQDLSNQAVGEGKGGNQLVSEARNLISLSADCLNPQRRIARNLDNLQGIFTDFFSNRAFEEVRYQSKFSGLQAKLDKALRYETLPQILRVFDRISMAESVESRMPFMDYRLIDTSFQAGQGAILNKTGSKALLRDALSDLIPQHILIQKRKQGFSGDENRWYRDQEVLSAFESIIKDGLIYEVPGIDPENYKKAVNKLRSSTHFPLLHKSVWLGFSYSIWYSLFILGNKFTTEEK